MSKTIKLTAKRTAKAIKLSPAHKAAATRAANKAAAIEAARIEAARVAALTPGRKLWRQSGPMGILLRLP